MPVFKVVGTDRSRKIMIVGKSIEELITSAKTKLKLPESKEGYTVFLEEDGTEIPDTDTLEEFIKDCSTPITLMILEKNAEWTPKPTECLSQSMIETILAAEVINQPAGESIPLNVNQQTLQDKNIETSAGPSTATPQNQGHCNAQQNLGGPSTIIARPKIPWDKFPKRLIEDCERGNPVQAFDRNSMVRAIAEYLVDELKQADRTNCAIVANNILKKYPNSFRVKINGSLVSDGKLKLITQIYNRVNYCRSLKDDGAKKKVITDSDDETEIAVTKTIKKKTSRSSKSIQLDEYGCVEYEPSLPLTESKQSQSEAKKLLFEQADVPCSSRDVATVKNLLDQTYPSQRTDINYRTGDINEVLLDWPLLMEAQSLLHHASILLGKPINDIWRDKLTQNLIIHNFMKQHCISMQKSKKTQDDLHVEKISKILLEAKQTSANMENNSSLVLAIFPLVASYFKENIDFLYKVVNLDDFGDEQIHKVVPNPSPVLVINGQSLFDPSAACAVVTERKISCLAEDTLEGMLASFVGYYIFGLSYPTELSKTLEFIQRVLLDINPQSKSSKVKKGDKRKTSTYTPAVLTFYNKLKQYYREDEVNKT